MSKLCLYARFWWLYKTNKSLLSTFSLYIERDMGAKPRSEPNLKVCTSASSTSKKHQSPSEFGQTFIALYTFVDHQKLPWIDRMHKNCTLLLIYRGVDHIFSLRHCFSVSNAETCFYACLPFVCACRTSRQGWLCAHYHGIIRIQWVKIITPIVHGVVYNSFIWDGHPYHHPQQPAMRCLRRITLETCVHKETWNPMMTTTASTLTTRRRIIQFSHKFIFRLPLVLLAAYTLERKVEYPTSHLGYLFLIRIKHARCWCWIVVWLAAVGAEAVDDSDLRSKHSSLTLLAHCLARSHC